MTSSLHFLSISSFINHCFIWHYIVWAADSTTIGINVLHSIENEISEQLMWILFVLEKNFPWCNCYHCPVHLYHLRWPCNQIYPITVTFILQFPGIKTYLTIFNFLNVYDCNLFPLMCYVFSSPSEFQCASGQCIDTTLLCDGSKDCNDGSDETVRQCSNMRYVSYS